MGEPVFLIAFAIAAATVLMVVKTIAAAFNKSGGSRSELGQVKERLEQHSAALEEAENSLAHQSNQIAELQERLDFTERLLAEGRDRNALGPGEGRG